MVTRLPCYCSSRCFLKYAIHTLYPVLGLLNLAELIATDRISKAARGAFSEYQPGEVFAYKSTDPMTLGLMVSRATGMPLSQWIQEQVLNPRGIGGL